MSLPCSLLVTLLFLGMLCRLLDVLLPGLLLLIVLFLLLGMLLLLLLVLVLLLGLLLLRLFVLVLLLSLLWLLLCMLLLRRLGMLLLLLLLWPGFLLFVLCEGRNNSSQGQKQDGCSESCKCFHWYCLNYRLGVRATNSCILLTATGCAQVGLRQRSSVKDAIVCTAVVG